MKNIISTILCLLCCYGAFAQQKNTTGTMMKQTTANGKITHHNYQTVVRYINDMVNCMNKQEEALKSREEYATTWFNYYVYDKPGTERKVIYSNYMAIDIMHSEAITSCSADAAPDIMTTEDMQFYNEQFKILRDRFKGMAHIWNNLATYSRPNVPELEYARKQCGEWIKLEQEYYDARENIGNRNKQLQRQLFPFSIMDSPHAASYGQMYSDLNALQDLANSITNDAAMQEQYESLLETLGRIEEVLKERMINASEENRPAHYGDFYETANNFVNRSRVLLSSSNGSEEMQKSAIDNYNAALEALVPAYNEAME